MNTCTFCQIVKKMKEAYIVYEDDEVIAFLDKYPLFKDHTLVVPKEHYENIFEAPDEVLCKLIKIAKKIAKAQIKTLNADGVRILQNNGRAAKQIIFHVHFHVIPFYYGLEIKYPRLEINKDDAVEVVNLLREALENG